MPPPKRLGDASVCAVFLKKGCGICLFVLTFAYFGARFPLAQEPVTPNARVRPPKWPLFQLTEPEEGPADQTSGEDQSEGPVPSSPDSAAASSKPRNRARCARPRTAANLQHLFTDDVGDDKTDLRTSLIAPTADLAPQLLPIAGEDETTALMSRANAVSLQEQIADLRAQVASLTAAQSTVPAPDDNGQGVQGGLFGAGTASAPIDTGMGTDGGSVPSTVQGSVFGVDVGPSSTWVNDGLTFVSKNGEFRTHLGGAVHLDAIGYGHVPGDIVVPGWAGTQDTVEFRRIRVRADGTMYKYIDWVSEFDFAFALQNVDPNTPAAPLTGLRSVPTGVGTQPGNTINAIQPTTIFLTFKEVPLFGNIRVGNQQDWFSLEHIESARFLDFMERSPLMDAFSGANNNGYVPGISAFNNTDDMSAGAQIGVYKNNVYDSGVTYSIGDAWTYGSRVIWSPIYHDGPEEDYLLHVGVGTEYRTFNKNVSSSTDFDNIRIRSRGVLRNTASTLDPNYADTGNFFATSQALLDPEIAVVYGPWLIQSEYTTSWFYGAKPAKNIPVSLGSVFMEGGYVEALYFVTGESRTYNRQQGVFNRVIPKDNWDRRKRTWGALQLGVRYDWLDLNSGALVNGGNASDVTFGINWFLNANARFQFNYVIAWVNNAPATTFPSTMGALNGSRFVGDGTINSFGARMDFNF